VFAGSKQEGKNVSALVTLECLGHAPNQNRELATFEVEGLPPTTVVKHTAENKGLGGYLRSNVASHSNAELPDQSDRIAPPINLTNLDPRVSNTTTQTGVPLLNRQILSESSAAKTVGFPSPAPRRMPLPGNGALARPPPRAMKAFDEKTNELLAQRFRNTAPYQSDFPAQNPAPPSALCVNNQQLVSEKSEQNLPAAAHQNLPAAAHQNLPAAAHQNLPTAAHQNLPTAAHQNLPAAAHQNLPAAAHQNTFITISQNLPVTVQHHTSSVEPQNVSESAQRRTLTTSLPATALRNMIRRTPQPPTPQKRVSAPQITPTPHENLVEHFTQHTNMNTQNSGSYLAPSFDSLDISKTLAMPLKLSLTEQPVAMDLDCSDNNSKPSGKNAISRLYELGQRVGHQPKFEEIDRTPPSCKAR